MSELGGERRASRPFVRTLEEELLAEGDDARCAEQNELALKMDAETQNFILLSA